MPVSLAFAKGRLIKSYTEPKPIVSQTMTTLKMLDDEDGEVVWNLSADKVNSLNEANIYEAEGHVVISRGNDRLEADFARYFMDTKWIYLRGNVAVKMGRDDLKAQEAEFDLANRTGWLKDGTVFMADQHLIFKGEQVQKHTGDVYSFYNARLTACEGDVPAWSLSAEEAVVEVDGYARLWDASFNIKDTSIVKTPVMILPAKKTRQSGFLMPHLSYSTRNGATYSQPYFWAIDDSHDVTVNTSFMLERGVMGGFDYRAAPSTHDNVWFAADFLQDAKNVTSPASTLYRGDNLMRTNYDRWWIRGMGDFLLEDPRWRLKTDLDLVSDQEYLQEFKRGRQGFDRNQNDAFGMFSRDLAEKDDKRVSGAMIERDWERFGFNAGLTYTQNQYLGNGNMARSQDTTVQELPEMNAFLYRGEVIDGFPLLEAEAHGQISYFTRTKGPKGSRALLHPRVIVPLTSEYGSIIGSFGIQQANYGTEGNDYSWIEGIDGTLTKGDKATRYNRTIPEFDIASSTEFMRVFSLDYTPLELNEKNAGESVWTGLRHSVQPRVGYKNVANENQNRLPYYDDYDRLEPRNDIYYSVTNVLTRKRERVSVKTDKKGELIPELETDYLDVLRFRVEQSYDIREADRDYDKEYPRRPFSDLLTDLTVSPTEYFSVYSKLWWSTEDGKLTRSDQGVRISYADWGSLSSGYFYRSDLDEYKRQRPDEVNYIYASGDLNVGGPWWLGFSYARDIEGSADIEKAVAIGYRHQCFFISSEFAIEPDEKSFGLFIELAGLGE